MNRNRAIFLVLHHEIIEHGPGVYWADDIVSHVASSLSKALRHIKQTYISEYAWWEIEKQILDRRDEPVRIGWYGPRGGKLKAAPFKKAIAAFKKCKSDPNHHLNI